LSSSINKFISVCLFQKFKRFSLWKN